MRFDSFATADLDENALASGSGLVAFLHQYETIPMTERSSTYEGEKLSIVYDRKLCIHVGECGRGNGDLFDAKKDPWCTPDAVDAAEAIDVVERCPSGALVYTRKDGGSEEQAPAQNEITVSQDGPLYVWGSLEIEGRDGQGSPFRAALCRCGASENKPFCDGSHVGAKFRDSGAVGERGTGLEVTGGTLAIKKAPNGPLLLNGNFTVRASTGRVAFAGTKAALCRCGASKNKPFCDGSHTAIGFTGE